MYGHKKTCLWKCLLNIVICFFQQLLCLKCQFCYSIKVEDIRYVLMDCVWMECNSDLVFKISVDEYRNSEFLCIMIIIKYILYLKKKLRFHLHAILIISPQAAKFGFGVCLRQNIGLLASAEFSVNSYDCFHSLLTYKLYDLPRRTMNVFMRGKLILPDLVRYTLVFFSTFSNKIGFLYRAKDEL